ncbi:MAG: hypothetical protein NXI30_19190 [bacterium]|nr:hypothetical protein [bacterium]
MAKVANSVLSRVLWLAIAWPAPAAIAGLAGWTGIWGSGSAFFDYLVPIPVAGGVLHVPTFAAATAIVFAFGRRADVAEGDARWLGPLLLGLTLFGFAMLLDLERLGRFLFLDAPFPRRFEKNALALFVTTDFGLALLWTRGPRVSRRAAASGALAVAIVLLGWQGYRVVTALELWHGATTPGRAPGDRIRWIYSSSTSLVEIDDPLLDLALQYPPEEDDTTEDVAFFVTSSASAAREGIAEEVFATICLYEDGPRAIMEEGRVDCFRHASFSDRLAAGEIDLARFCPRLEGLQARFQPRRADSAARQAWRDRRGTLETP